MEYENKLQENIVNYFMDRDDFYYHGYTGTFFFNTWKKGKEKESIRSKKPHGDKDSISASVLIYTNRYEENKKFGVEFKIQMYMWGYQSEEEVFQGWAEGVEDVKLICKAVGL